MIIRDLGYFEIKDLQAIKEKGCYFLTRIPTSIKRYTGKDSQPFDIWAKLSSIKENHFEQDLTVKINHQLELWP